MTHMEQIRECLLFQTDPRLPYPINRYGCRVMVLLAIPQVIVGECLSVEQVLDITEKGREFPGAIVNDRMKTGAEENRLIDWAFEALGSNRHGRQVGWNPEHIIDRTWQYMICHWETAGPDGHYTLFDRAQKEIYDPHDPKQAGYEIDKRKIVRKLLYKTWEG